MTIKDKKLVALIYAWRAARCRILRQQARLVICKYLELGSEHKQSGVYLHNYLDEHHALDFKAAWS